jgi:Fe-S cluster assembly iron-binding protein IscA
MLTVTEAASGHLAELLTDAEAPEGVAVRFVRQEDGLAMSMDNPQSGDTTFEHEGRTVLALEDEVAQLLTQNTLDIEDSDDGPQLALQ